MEREREREREREKEQEERYKRSTEHGVRRVTWKRRGRRGEGRDKEKEQNRLK